MKFSTFWHDLSYLGVTPELPVDFRKKIVLTNRISITVGIVISAMSVAYFSIPLLFALNLIGGVIYSAPLLLNFFRHYNFSRYILVYVPPAFLVVGSGLMNDGPSTSLRFALISVIVLPMLLFQITESRKMWLGVAWIMAISVLYGPVSEAIPQLPDITDSHQFDNPASQLASYLRSLVFFIASFVYQQRINLNTEQQLGQALQIAEAQNQTIRLQNQRLQEQFDELERQKTAIEVINRELRLQALKAQINPHFVFNALNSIQHFVMQKNTMEALSYLSKFAKLIRQTLENSVNERVSVADEMKALTYYLDLEKLRFNDAFTYKIELDDELDDHSTEIQPMLLQPYIENSILHGLRHRPDGGGLLKILILQQFDRLLCIIEDNGIGRQASAIVNASRAKNHISRGTNVTDTRLKLLNSDSADSVSVVTIDLFDESHQPRGTRVEVTIPI